jgi:hypothetical protein
MAMREMPDPDELRKQYPSNSNKSKDLKKASNDEPEDTEKKEIHQVTTPKKVRKQGFLKKFGKSIIEDGIETAKEKAYNDIIVPGFKALIFDTVTDVLDTVLFGGSEGGSRYSQRRSGNRRREERTSYRDFYDKPARRGSRDYDRDESPYYPDDIIVATRSEAMDILNELDHVIRKYGQASIADFYDLVGITSDWTDNRYGWISMRGASVKPVRDGFMIVTPRTRLLDD